VAWIESHQELERHPKLFDLQVALNLNQNEVIGILHRLWWWCVDYCEDGDLRKFNDEQIAHAAGLSGRGKDFVSAMKKTGFLDVEPYFRIHDWWDYVGRYLQGKYSRHPEKWQSIQTAYKHHTLPDLDLTKPTKPKTLCPAEAEPYIAFQDYCKQVIDFLNTKSGRKYEYQSLAVQRLLKALYNEGKTAEDCKLVITNQFIEWTTIDEKGNIMGKIVYDKRTNRETDMSQFLRPSTLFNATNFSNYLPAAQQKLEQEKKK